MCAVISRSAVDIERGVDSPVSSFLRSHFQHFNAATVIDAADGYSRHIDGGGKMLVTLAGAMSTAAPVSFSFAGR